MANLVLLARDVQQATPRARLISLDLGTHSFPYTAGQAIFAGLADGAVRRPYSIASAPSHAEATHTLELLVQIDDHSAPDPKLERVQRGTRLLIEGPFGSFGLPSPLVEHDVLFIAGGTGIAPLRAMLWEILERHREISPALIYTARSPDEFAFREELVGLVQQGRLNLHLTVTRDAGSRWSGARGRIDTAVIRSMMKSAAPPCLICGPARFVIDCMALLKAAGVPDEKIGFETS